MNRFRTLIHILPVSWITLFLNYPVITSGQDTPNFLIIMTDQQAWDALGYAGNEQIMTPNLDRLAGEGVNFSQAVTPCPVCVPARTSILTGRLTETTTIRQNQDAKSGDCYYPTFDEILAKRGYRTEYYGKFHAPGHMAGVYMNPPVDGLDATEAIIRWEPLYVQYLKENFSKRDLKPGELYENTFYGGTVPYKLDPPDSYFEYMPAGDIPPEELSRKRGQGEIHGVLDLPAEFTVTSVQGRQALQALERIHNEPFILSCSFHCPHVPITPSEPYASMYKAEDMQTSLSMADPRENSPYRPGVPMPPYNDKEKVKYMVANYYAFVTEIDEWVGKILDKLDELNLAENTLVVFVSDHGEMLGAHGMRGKFNFYEESVRVPFIIRYPGKIPPGRNISTPVSVLNIYPTILEYAGLKNIPSDGYSLKGLMEGREAPEYDFAVSEWAWTNQSVPSIMIRTRDWKLMTTHRKGGKNIEALFDLNNDPHEMNNLLGSNPDRFEYADTAEKLRSALVRYLREVNYPLVQGIEERVLIRE
jgi:arylsulfatase A-like enzyme